MNELDGIASIIQSYINTDTLYSVPFLMFLGNILKKSKGIKDELIPEILVLIGIAISCMICLSFNHPDTIIRWILLFVTAIGQGYFAAAAAITLHQMLKQRKAYQIFKKFNGGSEDE